MCKPARHLEIEVQTDDTIAHNEYVHVNCLLADELM